MGATSATFTITFDPNVLSLTNVTIGPVGNSNGGVLNYSQPIAGTINISVAGVSPMSGAGALVNLNFNVINVPGWFSPLVFSTFQYNNGPPCGTADDGSVTVISGTITGRVLYGNLLAPPGTRPIPNVLLSAAGSPPVSATTDSLGMYSINNFGWGGYVITPSKTGGVNGAVTGFDAARTVQHVVQLVVLNSTQQTVAEVSGGGGISTFDATLIARYAVSLPPPTGSAGNWIFNPQNRSYTTIYTNVINQDYTALLMGDVSGSWGSGGLRGSNGPERSVNVKAADITADVGTDVTIPVTVEGAAGKGIISYEFDLRYDASVIQPQADPVDLSESVSNGLSVVTNAEEPGLLRVTVYGPLPIGLNGTLFDLRFRAVGAPGTVSPLTWERLIFNDGDPNATVIDGRVAISGATRF